MRFSKALENLSAYHGGPSVAALKEQYGLERVARLSANEWYEGPFPEVIEVLKDALCGLNRYPDGTCAALREAVAQRLKIEPDLLMFGNGSCELLMLLGQAFVEPGERMVFPEPSFVMYHLIGLARQARLEPVPLPAFDYDLDVLSRAADETTRLLIVCNPNNPTGSYITPGKLHAFLRTVGRETAVVLDEAYGEFVTHPEREDSVSLLPEFPNLVILRTFSKIYGLAGLRVGYGVAHPDVIEAVDKLRQPFNVDSMSQLAALESLRHPARLEERRQHIAVERDRVSSELRTLHVGVLPSQANFLLVDVRELCIAAEDAPQELIRRGILTRSGFAMGCPGHVRVTIGSRVENDRFLAAMKELRTGT